MFRVWEILSYYKSFSGPVAVRIVLLYLSNSITFSDASAKVAMQVAARDMQGVLWGE